MKRKLPAAVTGLAALFFAALSPNTHKANENLPIAGGPPFAERHRKITAWSISSGKGRAEFSGKQLAAVSDDAVYLAGTGKVAAHELGSMKQKWEIDRGPAFALAAAGDTVVVGGQDAANAPLQRVRARPGDRRRVGL